MLTKHSSWVLLTHHPSLRLTGTAFFPDSYWQSIFPWVLLKMKEIESRGSRIPSIPLPRWANEDSKRAKKLLQQHDVMETIARHNKMTSLITQGIHSGASRISKRRTSISWGRGSSMYYVAKPPWKWKINWPFFLGGRGSHAPLYLRNDTWQRT